MSTLRDTTDFCRFCSFIVGQFGKTNRADVPDAWVENEKSLVTLHVPETSDVQPIFRIYSQANPRTFKATSVELLRAWLADCDRHACKKPRQHQLPSRLLNLSISNDAEYLRLDSSEIIEGNQPYLALSHCWGKFNPDRHSDYCTVTTNFHQRQTGFSLRELPKTLQDAVQITRSLGIQYLWIDSLCIIQDSENDWKEQSKQMEHVFASAYCTIAATSAENIDDGFLDGPVDHESIHVRHAEAAYLVSTNVADFDRDVNEAKLNKRAWVMQERFLSPRTIHFCKNQAYAECGEGVYAGDQIFLTSTFKSRNYYNIDPDFPGRLEWLSTNGVVIFLMLLMEDYTKRGMSKPADRPVAISALMARLGNSLDTAIYHGVIEAFLHRTLLWRRYNGPMTKIAYKDSTVPSWSWMAIDGDIDFMVHDSWRLYMFGKLRINQTFLTTTIWEFADPGMRIVVEDHNMINDVLDSKGLKQGWITLDEKVEQIEGTVVVIARQYLPDSNGDLYYVLFVKQKMSCGPAAYERIGVGMLHDCGLREIGEGYVY